MIGDASGYRFSPAKITIQRGDEVKFTLVSGPPHNVVFWEDSIPKGAAAKLGKAMTKTVGPLTGPFLLNAGDTLRDLVRRSPRGDVPLLLRAAPRARHARDRTVK